MVGVVVTAGNHPAKHGRGKEGKGQNESDYIEH